jgi:hypothetical protein
VRLIGLTLNPSAFADAKQAAVCANKQTAVRDGHAGAGLVVARFPHLGSVQNLAALSVNDMHSARVVHRVQFAIRSGW